MSLYVGSDGFSQQNAPLEHFERVSEQLCCEGVTLMVVFTAAKLIIDLLKAFPKRK